MELKQRIEAFHILGEHLKQFIANKDSNINLKKAITQTALKNPWFAPHFQIEAIENLIPWLNRKALSNWLQNYQLPETPLKIGVIMAGNIPLVGFHDFLSVLISGHHIHIKPSSKDPILLEALTNQLCDIEPEFADFINFNTNPEKTIDALIATGSNNTARYFEYNFKNTPRLIRHNRNSIAITEGNETEQELLKLAEDICTYYGLGCRNVSKIYIPEHKSLEQLKDALQRFEWLKNNKYYSENYQYQKARLKTMKIDYLDAGPVIFTENTALSSPIAVVNYEIYESKQYPVEQAHLQSENIQCVVGKFHQNCLPFGKSQKPELSDYADDTDTLKFLCSL